ncbi:Putative major facilitator superfamily MFS_1. Putative tetracycline resistance protein, class E [Magnetospira sp. QH-2]|nr:Putative major facilitator superfamily MFS_1. Putative tetracycline resistance protein, class E [Magnetospira sp. QH-2]
MLILFIIVFIDLVGFGIIIPLLPFYGEHFHATPDVVGLLMATYSLTQFIAAPYWGRLSDRHGRRPILLLTLGGLALSYVLLAYADTLLLLFVARALGGFMAGNISTAFAYVADITTPANRAKGMGVVGAAFGLGFIFGPAIGGLLAGDDVATADFYTPSMAAAGMSALALLLALFKLKESLSPEIRERLKNRPKRNRISQIREAFLRPVQGRLLLLTFLATFVFAGMETTFAMWSERQYGWGPFQNGILFACVGLLAAAMQGGLVGRLAKIFGESKLVVGGSAIMAMGLGLLPLATELPMLAVSMSLMAGGFSLLQPSLNSLLSLAASEEDQGGAMGIMRSISTLARVIGPAWAGFVFASFGKDWPYFGGAMIAAVVALIALGTLRRPVEPAEASSDA